MSDQLSKKPKDPLATVEYINSIAPAELNDLCDATDEAIKAGGGFGWVKLPSRDILERYWKGVLAMPARMMFVARLDGVICGTAQLITPPRNNEAQSFSVILTTNFISPWARGYGLARKLLKEVETKALSEGYSVITLDVRETQQAAISLYESAGFVRFGTNPFYACVDGGIIKGHHYYKVIDPAMTDQPVW